ncbi:LLM class flavin-dependent oxidoreductase [Devosia sp. LjRoot16]|uniref:LLM class flavin-dependent oxidoreductase n=1 Tax=Devosia sp. LjRoot16 TaxID=3342271 RepID=UPI003ECFF1F9
MTISKLSFLIPGNYAEADPHAGLEATLRIIELGEALGYHGAWVRQRHLEHGISSAAVFLAAASQRTRQIELGSAVIQIGYESPFRLAEDLAMAEALSAGRLNVGLSAGPPQHLDLLGPLVFDGDYRSFDFSHRRIARLVELLRAEPLGEPIAIPGGKAVPRLQPGVPGLLNRLWYGGGSLKSAEWAGANGFNLLVGNVTSGEGTDDFVTAQLNQIAVYRVQARGGSGRIALGRVIVPLDGASRATRERYLAYAQSRHARTLQPNGDKRTLFAPDLVGTLADIAERLTADAAVAAADELRLELPYEFDEADYAQILTNAIGLLTKS